MTDSYSYYQQQVADAPNQAERDYWLARIEGLR